jgi:hypothetical protein
MKQPPNNFLPNQKNWRASVVEVFQDVLDKLSDVGKKDQLLKFF